MKKFKSAVSAMLAVAVIFTLLPASIVRAADEITLDNIVYTLDTSNYTAEVKDATSAIGDVVIPAVITDGENEYKVTSIKGSSVSSSDTAGDGAFRKAEVDSVTLPEGIVSIGKEAFYKSTLTSINIPSTVRLEYASDIGIFKACSKMTDVRISEGLNCVPPQMFYYCTALSSLVFPKSVITVANSAFQRSYYLHDITFLADQLSVLTSKSAEGTFTLTGSNAWGNDKDSTVESMTEYHVQNDSVKAELKRAGISENNVAVLENYPVIFIYNDGVTETDTVEVDKADATVALPTAFREGYYFKGWHDGSTVYEEDTVYNLTAGLIFTAMWEKDYEADIILYKDISSHDTSNTFITPSYVRRIVCEDLKNISVNVVFTDEDDAETTTEVTFDKNGNWINYTDTKLYKKVEFPSGTDCSGLYILTDCDLDYEVTLPIKIERNVIFPRINWIFDQSEFEWTTSDITIAKVENGAIYGVKSGTATITVTYNDVSYSVKVNIVGEIANAIQNGTVSQYLDSKRPIINEINAAIQENNKIRLSAVVKSTGTIKLSDILDIDTSVIDSMTDTDFFDKFMDRIITYSSFNCDSTEDILYLSDVITAEKHAGYLNGIETGTEVESVLSSNAQYFGIDLNNKYYLENKDDVLDNFVNYTAKNVKSIKADFIEGYVISAYQNENGYKGLQTKIVDMQSEIGYKTEGFEAKNKAELYKSLLNQKENISTIQALKAYIDNFKISTNSGDSGSGGSGGGGGGSASLIGGSLVGNKEVDAFVDDKSAQNIVDNSIPKQEALFNDVSTDRWSYQSIQVLVANGAVSGYEDGNFYPERNVTRAEFVKIISNAFDLIVEEQEDKETTESTENTDTEEESVVEMFSDVAPDSWYFKAVNAAKENGLITGGNNNCFNPDALITREEMTTILYRLMVLKGMDFNSGNSIKFNDESQINDWAYLSVMQLSKMGIINGYADGAFKPHSNATREEAVKMIADTLSKYKA